MIDPHSFQPFVLTVEAFLRCDLVLRRDPDLITGSTNWMPMDLCMIDDHYVLTADLPGVDPASVGVDVDNGTLTVSGPAAPRRRATPCSG
jgi:HSP20 family protein